VPDDLPASTLGGIIGCEHGRPSHGRPGPAMAGGGIDGILDSSMLVEPTSEEWEEPTLVMSGADGASQGAATVEVDGASA
jgi:hypothetical protein